MWSFFLHLPTLAMITFLLAEIKVKTILREWEREHLHLGPSHGIHQQVQNHWLLKRTLFAIWATYNKLYLSPGWQSISIYEILRRMGKTTTKQRNRTQPHLVLMLEKNIWPLPQWLTSEYMNNMSLSFPKHNKQQKNKFVDCLTEIFLSGYGWRCKYSCALKIVVLDMYQPQTQL